LRNRPMHIQEIMQALNVTKSGAHVILKPLIRFGIVSREGGYQSGKYLINKD
jgi:predicted transcriptional regulator